MEEGMYWQIIHMLKPMLYEVWIFQNETGGKEKKNEIIKHW